MQLCQAESQDDALSPLVPYTIKSCIGTKPRKCLVLHLLSAAVSSIYRLFLARPTVFRAIFKSDCPAVLESDHRNL
ncbi:hypothetical protein KCV07_g344, partial [Aureobasidium melanogenum]